MSNPEDEEKLFMDMVVREDEVFYLPAGDPDLWDREYICDPTPVFTYEPPEKKVTVDGKPDAKD